VLTMPTVVFLDLISDALATASTDPLLPALTAVHLHTQQGMLVATSTDRYALAQVHVGCEGELPPVVLLGSDLRNVLRIFRGFRWQPTGVRSQLRMPRPLNVEVTGKRVRFWQDPAEGLTAEMTLSAFDGQWPGSQVMKYLRRADDAPTAPSGVVDAKRLLPLVRVAARRSAGIAPIGVEHVKLETSPGLPAQLTYVTTDGYRAVLVGVKERNTPAPVPVFDLPAADGG
jgi:DNA polymerase III beta subunit, central domain